MGNYLVVSLLLSVPRLVGSWLVMVSKGNEAGGWRWHGLVIQALEMQGWTDYDDYDRWYLVDFFFSFSEC